MASSEEKLIPVKVSGIHDLARIAASIITLGQPAYLVRLPSRNGGKVYGIIAVLRDYYKLYGLPMLYYYVDDEGRLGDGNYLLVKVDDQGEHVELSKSTRPGWVAIPIIDLAEKPPFFPDEL
ncbi:hypothetical protein [Hyperthermus butylicus]|uniref:Crenarchaeal protein n=1 Tax=Hyperthermus butylicus (strain DSM 5456 / JCM 9403 / PLM1-5) TaxID=415426 RepID=A2BJ35_HYPBU|nr:hypothetical protein [Hyperthermus butylicus]ABM79996.1 putative crenarchaeal protein [Hyperthermus butylicus DSM 5456]